jgi:hypothetical protein
VNLLNTVVQLVVGYTPKYLFVILPARNLLFEYWQSQDTVHFFPFGCWVTESVVVCDALFRAYQAELVTRRRCVQVMAVRL